MLHILITNDDGIAADGLRRLAKAASQYGKVWVVAPDGQRSGTSHNISMLTPLDVFPYPFPVEGVSAFTCSGSPADCVRVGSLNLMPQKPDVVLSGINNGFNVASDIQYSGTAGAAFEAAFQGYHAIAVSEETNTAHEVTDAYLHEILEKLLAEPLPPGAIWNVNFPNCPLAECKGIRFNRTVSRDMLYHDHYNIIEQLPNGGMRFMIEGDYHEEAEAGTDLDAVIHDYVAVGIVHNVG